MYRLGAQASSSSGGFESDFFYPVQLGVLKKVAGSLFDSMARRGVKK